MPVLGLKCMVSVAGDSTIKRTPHTAEQIIRKLKTTEQVVAQGKNIADLCRALETMGPFQKNQ